MAVGQAFGAFKLFTGLEPDATRMEAHFHRLIAQREAEEMTCPKLTSFAAPEGARQSLRAAGRS